MTKDLLVCLSTSIRLSSPSTWNASLLWRSKSPNVASYRKNGKQYTVGWPTSAPCCIWYRNQSSDLQYKSNAWFLHEIQHWAKTNYYLGVITDEHFLNCSGMEESHLCFEICPIITNLETDLFHCSKQSLKCLQNVFDSGQCSHFIPPGVFRGYKMGTLARYGLKKVTKKRLKNYWHQQKWPLNNFLKTFK